MMRHRRRQVRRIMLSRHVTFTHDPTKILDCGNLRCVTSHVYVHSVCKLPNIT